MAAQETPTLFNIALSMSLVLGLFAGVSEPQLQISRVEGIVLAFPHDGPTEFANTWGAGRPGGRRHQGTDLMADKMTPVVAAADGVIDTIDEGPRSGRFIRIVHAGDWETWYMHLNDDTPGTDDGRAAWEFTVAKDLVEGSFVRAGQPIGYVGDSGNAEYASPHTHFELHHPTQGRINPYPYLVPAWERFEITIEERRHAAVVRAIGEAAVQVD